MMHGDFWIYPDGSCQEMGGSEHAAVAMATMMKLPPEEHIMRNQIFNGLAAFSKEQIARAKAQGVEKKVFDFLSRPGNDPRAFVIQHYGWIRIAKSSINVWLWDEQTIATLCGSSYWSQQPEITPQDMFDVVGLVTNFKFSITVEKIMGGIDLGVGAVEPEVGRVFVPPSRGMHTDTAGDTQWRYRRIGDNKRRE